MSVILNLLNPGTGDATFLKNDKRLRATLATFPENSYSLTAYTVPNSICGGWNYDLEIFSNISTIKLAVEQLGLDQGDFDRSSPKENTPQDKTRF